LFTDDDGRVVVPGARGLPLLVRLEHPGHAPLALELDTAESEHRVALDPGRTLRGTITARGGRDRIEGGEITLYTDTGARHAKSDARGEFEVSDVAAGRVRLLARAKGYAVTERVILFDGDARRPVTIEPLDLPLAGSVTGVVVDASEQPIRGARVGYGGVPTYLPVGPLPRGLAPTDGDGRFVLDDVPEGEVTIEAYSAALGRGRVDRVVVRAGRTTDRVTVTIPEQDYDPRRPRGAGSVAVTLAERSGSVYVVDVPEGGEAEHAGLEPDDRLVAIFETSVSTIEAARDAFGGPTSEDVVVTIERADPKDGSRQKRLRVRREVVRR
jgi:hypothetical protein